MPRSTSPASTCPAATAPPTSSAGTTGTRMCPREWPLDAQSVAVIGNGNVALDVARMLAKHADDLLPTEIPDNVYQALKASPVTDVHVFGRRGPMQVKFTPLELRELGELRRRRHGRARGGLRLRRGVASRDRDQQAGHGDRPDLHEVARSAQVGSASRRLHLHFYAKPGRGAWRDRDGRVAGVPLRAHRAGRRGRRRAAPARSARSPSRRSTARSATSVRRSTACRSTRSAASSRTARARC